MSTPISSTNYDQLWQTMVIRPDWAGKAKNAAAIITTKKHLYEAFVTKYNSNMPWYVAGIIHMMESSCSFTRHLHNGDSLAKRTINEPKGRPLANPINGFSAGYTWIESATDALNMKGYAQLHDWSTKQILARLEKYNGTGYQTRGINSPYLWSGSNHYTKGKYVKDGKFDPMATSAQVGAAVLLNLISDAAIGS